MSALAVLVERGFVENASNLDAIDRALTDGPVTFYTGYDPTAPSLHVGHLVTLLAARILQQHGHRPLIVAGGGTAQVGDPSGKTETRKLLASDVIADNMRQLRVQVGALLHFDSGEQNDAVWLNNAEWLTPLNFIDFLRTIGRHFTVNRMIATKTYRDRLEAEEPLSLLEFNYQLLQAYDFLHLQRAYGCSLQLGGADQWGNMIAGVELIRREAAATGDGSESPDHAHCLTYPLIVNSDGKKMGKTERGAVWLSADRCPPFDYYQYWINTDDRDVARWLKIYTDLPLAEIEILTAVEGAALREAKAKLAFEATAMLHGRAAAVAAEAGARQAFGASDDWSALPATELPELELKLIDLVVHPAIAGFKSKREARERILAGAVKLGGNPIVDPNADVRTDRDDHVRLQVGKRRFRIRFGAGGLA